MSPLHQLGIWYSIDLNNKSHKNLADEKCELQIVNCMTVNKIRCLKHSIWFLSLMWSCFSVHAPFCGLLPTRWHGVQWQVCDACGPACGLPDRSCSLGRAWYQWTACLLPAHSPRYGLVLSLFTHLPLDKMAAISQTIFSGAFSCMKNFVFWLKFTEVCS